MKTRWTVYDSPMLDKIIASFNSKREVIEYGEKNQINADRVVVWDKQNPAGYCFLGWDEIESF